MIIRRLKIYSGRETPQFLLANDELRKGTMNSEKGNFKILMFPWLAHGHIFPFLELAKKILKTRNFHIYLCTTQINFTSINSFITTNSLQNSIELLQLHLEPNPDLPPHLHTTKNLPSNLNFSLLKAFQTSKSSFSHILTDLHPDLLIYDVFQPWAAALAASLSIPAVHFVIVGAATRSFVHHHYVRFDEAFPFPELCLEGKEKKSLDSLIDFLYANVFDFNKDVFFVNFRLSAEVVLLKTCRAVEGKYVDYVSSVSRKRIVTVGPLISGSHDEDRAAEVGRSELIQWLNKNPKNSTVYVSFGSECFLSEREVAEVAKGLELCKAKFVWVIRYPAAAAGEGEEREEALPEGFEERMREKGRVVKGWAPQREILGHRSVGAFVSHCGWSSVNESVYCGVPVVAMPVRFNMFVDAKMLVSMGVGVEVGRGEEGWYEGEEIRRKIDEVVVEGEEMRRRARELSERMREEEEGREGGEVGEVLWQICVNKWRKAATPTPPPPHNR